jgi:uncharacterized protein YciI
MNVKHRILGLVVVFGAIGLAACEETPQKDVAAEQKEAQEKIAKAEKEAAEKTAKAKREADEKIASAARELAEKKAEVKKDLAEELADRKYEAFVGMNDYKAFVTARVDEHEKRLAELKAKGESAGATMKADAKKEWNDSMKAAEAELKAARANLKNLDTTTEATWSSTKAKVDAAVKNFAKSVETLGQKIDQKI